MDGKPSKRRSFPHVIGTLAQAANSFKSRKHSVRSEPSKSRPPARRSSDIQVLPGVGAAANPPSSTPSVFDDGLDKLYEESLAEANKRPSSHGEREQPQGAHPTLLAMTSI